MTDNVPGGIFELRIDEHVPFVDPRTYGINDFQGINPRDYFITSGDAVCKASQLERELWEAAGAARRLYGQAKNKRHQQFQKDLWIAAGKCRTLVNRLKNVRGDAIFLETEYRDHKLYCIPKNPRAKGRNDDVD
jgi:hypothetical protein